ncbi:uncharacterized protein [Euphorbia lathyris]|uniref:uncharacterized protein n=1 Tax=Euphorbia lathyris TaxID=212925 RepID=UPI0033139D3A
MVGAIANGQIAEYIGRKGSLMIAAIPNIIGWLAITFSRVPVNIALKTREKISEIEKIAEMYSILKSVMGNNMLVIKAASKELEGSLMELVELQKWMGEAEKRRSV